MRLDIPKFNKCKMTYSYMKSKKGATVWPFEKLGTVILVVAFLVLMSFAIAYYSGRLDALITKIQEVVRFFR